MCCKGFLNVVLTITCSSAAEAPAPKKAKITGKLDSFLSKGKEQEAFLKDTVKAFAAANVPLEKLANGSPLREYFNKYVPQCSMLVDSDNLRRTWLPKVLDEGLFLCFDLICDVFTPSQHPSGIKQLGNIFREKKHYICIGLDETDDPRPTNEYILTLEVLLIPKICDENDSMETRSFHLKLEFPSVCIRGHGSLSLLFMTVFFQEVNQSSVADILDKVLREFLIVPEDVIYFCHDSASYMSPAAGVFFNCSFKNNVIDLQFHASSLAK